MKIALFGGTGFVGSYILNELIKADYKVRALVRKGSESKLVDDCEIIFGEINDKQSVNETIKDVDAIIYNIGIIRENLLKGITNKKLHFDGVNNCIEASKKNGIKRFILMSANGVKPSGTSYQRTKWEADELLMSSNLDWTIFRPSLIFGDPRGGNRPEFCTQLRDDMLSLPIPAPLFYKGIFPIKAGMFSLSPIHVEDVSNFFVKSISKLDSIGNIYNLGGKQSFTWKEIIHEIAIASGKLTWKIPAPVFIIKFIASLLDRFNWFPVTRDQIIMLVEGNLVEEQYFDDFNIEPKLFNRNNLEYLKK